MFDDKLTIERAKLEMKIHMPREILVDSNFSDFEEDEMEFSNNKHSSVSSVIAPQTKRVLIESDFQKLMMAKSKLTEILSLTEILHQKNNW